MLADLDVMAAWERIFTIKKGGYGMDHPTVEVL